MRTGSGQEFKSYSELISIPSFEGRVRYCQVFGQLPSQKTFAELRYLNQRLYSSPQWHRLRRDIILRDNGNELAFDGKPIFNRITIHHLNPLRPEDFYSNSELIFDPENLVAVSHDMHNLIHYAMGSYTKDQEYIPRQPDTIPWR